jgi:uncharacterized membrane protein (DUF4010 family)
MDQLAIASADLSASLRLLTALALGLLIGLEREWRWRNGGASHLGLRTFGLIGLLGGLAGLLRPSIGEWMVPAALLALALLLAVDHALDRRQAEKDPGKADPVEDSTTLVAALATFLLGTLAAAGMAQLAAGTAVVVAVLLNLKPTLHRWVGALSQIELRAVLRLLVISLVILPVLPDQGYGPYQALNPRTIWLFVVLLSTLSFVGYLAIRILGARRGYLATGFFGGLVSSTATTAALARLGRSDPARTHAMAAGIAIANAVMAIRMAVITGFFNPRLAFAAAWPLGCAALAAALFAVLLWRRSTAAKVSNDVAGKAETKPIEMENPFEIGPALRLAAVLAVVLVLAKFLEERYGQSGIQVLAAIAGLVDVDAITLTVARDQAIPMAAAVASLLIAALANTIFKGVLLGWAGGRIAGWGIAVLVAMVIAGGIAWLIPSPWENLQLSG